GGTIRIRLQPMRHLLLAASLLIATPCFAQQAANPVEPFSYGHRVGTASNPLYAAISSVVPSASAQSGQAAAPVEMFSYGHRVGTQSNPIYVNLGATNFLTQSAADARYVQPAADGGIMMPTITTAALAGKTCDAAHQGEMWWVSDGTAFVDVATSSKSSPIWQDTSTPTSPGVLAVCGNLAGKLQYMPIDTHAGAVAAR
ncbi:hypothetical protein, partial [Kozakia baliensis]|uniref:hypothetical protein n=1 Tax=Kozakia baliensis TaxID=153496 RepID=UPI00056686BA